MDISDAEERFLLWLRSSKALSQNSVRAYSGDVAAFRLYIGGDFPVKDLSPDSLVRFFDSQRSTGLAPSSIRRRIAALRSFCSWLVDSGALNTDPWRQVTLRVRKPRTLPRPVDSADLGRLLRSLASAADLSVDRSPIGPLSYTRDDNPTCSGSHANHRPSRR
jgi:site-specific recombinase XerD